MASTREYREKLIDEVKKFPVLYDTRHEHHRDIDVRDRCWAQIAATLGANSEVLKREWKILRDSLRQSLKKSRAGLTTKSGSPCKKWRFHHRMAFLLPHMTRRNPRHGLRAELKLDLEEGGGEETETGGGGEEAAPAPALDALELFFASVCASARGLPSHHQRTLKRQVLDALLRVEAQAECPPPPAPAAPVAQPAPLPESSKSELYDDF